MRGEARLTAVFFPHRHLWIVANELRERLAEEPEAIRTLGIVTLLLLHNCFEGYLNYAGELLLPMEWAEERVVLREERYRGVMGKYLRLADELGVPVDRGCRPYTTVRTLKSWRDGIVHPKIERQSKLVGFSDAKYLSNLQTNLFRQVTTRFINRGIEDVEMLCDRIEAAAHQRDPQTFLGPGSFRGRLGETGGSIVKAAT
jgi:hypothetical protein